MNKASTALLSTALAFAAVPAARSAQVDLAKNPASAGSGSLSAGSSLAPGSSIVTGSKSRTQVGLGSHGSIVRAGSKTEAVLESERNLSLRQGVMLASSGRRPLGREALTVETPETKTTAKGTMLVAYQPTVYIKVTCIEGQVTVKLKALMGEFVTLDAGEMVIINPAEKRLPEEVEVDLDELTRTSTLLGSDFPQLFAASRVAGAVDRQARGITHGDAIRTQLVMPGAGLEVILGAERGTEARQDAVVTEPPEPPQVRGPARPPESPSRPPPYIPPDPDPVTGPDYTIDNTTVFSSEPSLTLQTPGLPVIQGQTGVEQPTLWTFQNVDPTRGPELLVRSEVNLPSNGSDAYLTEGVLHIGDASGADVGLNGQVTFHGRDGLVINSANIFTSGEQSSGVFLASDRDLSITGSDIDQRSHVIATAQSITVDRSRLAAGNDGILLHAIAAGGSLRVSNSSELLSMATSAGVVLLANGGNISVTDSRIDGRDVTIDSGGAAGMAEGTVEIRNSTINGDIIRARAFNSADRNALVINSSTFNANGLIKFYAEGASKLLFQGNNVLDLSASDGQGRAILAGRTVEVEPGAFVDVRGHVDVYRDVDNYNKSPYGRIGATGQQTHQSFSARPPF